MIKIPVLIVLELNIVIMYWIIFLKLGSNWFYFFLHCLAYSTSHTNVGDTSIHHCLTYLDRKKIYQTYILFAALCWSFSVHCIPTKMVDSIFLPILQHNIILRGYLMHFSLSRKDQYFMPVKQWITTNIKHNDILYTRIYVWRPTVLHKLIFSPLHC